MPGEFGHTVLQVMPPSDNAGRPCACGKRGCVEAFVSANGILMTTEELMKNSPASLLHKIPPPLTSEKVYEAAERGDETAQSVFCAYRPLSRCRLREPHQPAESRTDCSRGWSDGRRRSSLEKHAICREISRALSGGRRLPDSTIEIVA
jgi:hypothetical protein